MNGQYQPGDQVFGKWTLKRLLGEGSFGRVYEAEREDFGRVYKAAIKIVTIPQSQSEVQSVRADGMDDESVTTYFQGFVEEMVDEFDLMEKLKGHSNIVGYEDHEVIRHEEQIGWDILIRMELLTPLQQQLESAPLTKEDTLRLGIDLCKALELCQYYNIIHRDIKPENIFISELGEYKLGDFGIARTVEKTTGGLSKKGTPSYMAPEVYREQPYGVSADIYSLGTVLYWLMNKKRTPFLPLPPENPKYGDREIALRRRISGEPLPPPCNADGQLAAVIMKACAYRPEERYKTPMELRQALEELLTVHGEASEMNQSILEINQQSMNIIPDETITAEGTESIFKDVDAGSKKHHVKTEKTESVFEAPYTRHTSSAMVLKKKNQLDKDTRKHRRIFPLVAALLGIIAIVGVFFSTEFFLRHRNTEDKIGVLASSENIIEPSDIVDTKPSLDSEEIQWSEWTENLPDYVTEEDYEIEKLTQYRTREKETTTSSEATMEGWEQYDTSISTDEYGAWSNWSTTPAVMSDTRKVEEATQYRYRDLQSTTSGSNVLDGWILSDQTSTWGSYGPWSSWQTTPVSNSDSRQVETKTQYSYRTKTVSQEYTDWGEWSSWQDESISGSDITDVETRTVYLYYWYPCPNCGAHMHGYGFICPTWAGGCGQAMISDQYQVIWGTTPQSEMGFQDWHGTGHTYAYYEGNLVFRNIYNPNESKTQYRYRTRVLKDTVSYSEWSSYSDASVSASPTKEVRIRTVYRYRDRQLQYTYHFTRWGNWSDWSTNQVLGTATRQVETQKIYRYADKGQSIVYHFWRWGEWSEFSNAEIEETDNIDVENQTIYRYRPKIAPPQTS